MRCEPLSSALSLPPARGSVTRSCARPSAWSVHTSRRCLLTSSSDGQFPRIRQAQGRRSAVLFSASAHRVPPASGDARSATEVFRRRRWDLPSARKWRHLCGRMIGCRLWLMNNPAPASHPTKSCRPLKPLRPQHIATTATGCSSRRSSITQSICSIRRGML